MRSVSTGKVIEGNQIPTCGLLQSMFRPHTELSPRLLIESPGISHDRVQDQISTYFIVEALRRAYPDQLKRLADPVDPRTAQMPCIDRLPAGFKSQQFNLGTISFPESTVRDNY